ncbi:MAG: DNA primase [Anaerolineae bacterium]|nr:DNA primase [Gloeobacterales cyanobacterium ES-bin-313]
MMMPKLDPRTVDEVRSKADLYDVVSERVVLRKAGKDYKGLCPFHEDRSPSFYISPSKQIYKCFSCGASGDVFKFLMEQDKSSFTETVIALAQRYGISVQAAQPEQSAEYARKLTKRQQLSEIMELATQFYSYALHSEKGKAAYAYLKQRALTEKTIQQFRLGYSPAGWQSLYTYLVEQKHFPAKLVEEAGLIVPRGNSQGYYDRFRDRLMIPICDTKGQVIAFGGRALGDEQRPEAPCKKHPWGGSTLGVPKYLNSPETELFQKGQTLFAIHEAKMAIARMDAAIIVEGYFDAIALHQAGITHAVATLGTAMRSDQVKQLLRYTESKQVILNFDADNAGVQATERAIGELGDLVVKSGVQLRILHLPADKDPDEYLQSHSPQSYLELVKSAPLWLEWQVDRLFKGKDLGQTDDFQKVSRDLATLFSELPDSIGRTQYIHRVAGRLSQGNGRLAVQLEEDFRRRTRVRAKQKEAPTERAKTGEVSAHHKAEAQLLVIFIQVPELRELIRQAMAEHCIAIKVPEYRNLWDVLCAQTEHSNAHADLVVDHNSEATQSLLHHVDPFTLSRPKELFQATIKFLAIAECERQSTRIGQLCDEAEAQEDWEKWHVLWSNGNMKS